MKKLLNKYNWLHGFLGVLLVAAGITVIVLAIINKDSVSNTLVYIFAGLTIGFGALTIVLSLMSETRIPFTSSMLYGSILVAFGVTSLIVDNFIGSLLVNFLAVLLIALGSVCLAKAVFSIIYRMRKLHIFFLFVTSTVCITLGILALCFDEYAFIATFITAGGFIIAIGIYEIVLFMLKNKEQEKELEEKKNPKQKKEKTK